MGFWTGLLAKTFGNEAMGGGLSETRTARKEKLARRKSRQAVDAALPKPRSLKLPKQEKPEPADPPPHVLPRVKRKHNWQARMRLANSKRR